MADIIIIAIIVVIGVYISIHVKRWFNEYFVRMARMPGKVLQKKFQELGDMKGMSKTDIIAKCGNFKSINYSEGWSSCSWMELGYSISLIFDANDKVIKIGGESATT